MTLSEHFKLNLYAFLELLKFGGKLIVSQLLHLPTNSLKLFVKILAEVFNALNLELETWIRDLIDTECSLILDPMLVRHEPEVLSKHRVNIHIIHLDLGFWHPIFDIIWAERNQSWCFCFSKVDPIFAMIDLIKHFVLSAQ